MSTQTAVGAEPQKQGEPVGTEETADQRQSPFVETRFDADEAYPPRRMVTLAALGATTLVSVGALLGARFIGRRWVTHGRRSIRVKGGSPRILIMLPFTAVNLDGRRSRRFGLRRLSMRTRTLRHAGTARLQMGRRLPARLRQRIAAGR
jgi:hypothetical protein